MSKIPLVFYDWIEYNLPKKAKFHNGIEYVLEDTLDSAMKQMKGKKPRLFIKTKATHSGVLINKRVYPGIHMRDSVASWLESYDKPVLDQHPEIPTALNPLPREPRVVGRVTSAQYVPLVAESLLIQDFESPQPPGSNGSGYIELGCGISDQGAIEEILDGRKVTVSVGAIPSKVVCSVCKDDLKITGPCEHEPGKTYTVDTQGSSEKKLLAYLVTGRLKYHHLAFTWRPGDQIAKVDSAELQDSYNNWNYLKESPTKEAGQLLGFRFVDTDSGAFLDMDIPQSLTMPENSEETISDNKNTDRNKNQTISLRDAVLDNNTSTNQERQEDSMSNKPQDSVQDESAAAVENTESVEDTDSTENQEDQSTEVTDNHYWSQPDPKDGHTHAVELLDENFNGETTEAGSPAHKHEIRNGRVVPTTLEDGDNAYSSRHPGTYYYDTDGDKKSLVCDVKPNDPADGEPLQDSQAAQGSEDTQTDKDNKTDTDISDEPIIDYSDTDKNPDGVETMGEVELADHEQLLDWYAAHQDDQELQDAKLTAAARKKLPDSAFCGPDRSFPAHDKSHVRNALARLGQGFPKGASPQVKARIRACVVRKAKKMGVEVEDSAQDPEVQSFSDANTQATTLRTLAAQVDRLESENRRLKADLNDSREQIDQYKSSADELQEKNRLLLVDRIVDLEFATGRKNVKDYRSEEKLKEHKDELVKREYVSLCDTANDLQKELVFSDSVGTHPSLTEAPEIPVEGLGASPSKTEDNEEDSKPTDSASEYKNKVLSALSRKQEEAENN